MPSPAPTRPAAPAPTTTRAAPADTLGDVVRERILRLVAELGPERVEGLHPLVLREVERSVLSTLLDVAKGRQGEAARLAGLHRNTFRLRFRALGLDRTARR